MRWDLKKPCLNCPFRTDATAIRFQGRERAAEIEESAYRNGFPCHLSADHIEEEDDPFRGGGFVFGEETQHCAGALMLYLRNGCGNVPFENLSDAEQERISGRLDWSAPVWESEDEFLESYGDPAPEEVDEDEDEEEMADV